MNYRHPGFRRGDPRVRTAGRAPFPVQSRQNRQSRQIAGRLSERVKHTVLGTISRKMVPTIGLASPKWFLAITCTIWLCFQFWRRGFDRVIGARLFPVPCFKSLTRRRPLPPPFHIWRVKNQEHVKNGSGKNSLDFSFPENAKDAPGKDSLNFSFGP